MLSGTTRSEANITETLNHCAYLAHRPGAHPPPPPPPPGQPGMMNGGNYYNNMYPTQPGYYAAPGQAFYPAPPPGGYPGGYPGYPPPGRELTL